MKSVFRRPLIPTEKEINSNPMARSSKLRVAQKL
jgi:16S rRNA (cytosine1402-N4)-methyltransferase